MKSTKLNFIGALAIAGGMFFTGCTDECKDVVCTNGECVEGSCVCDAGYEGTDCGTAINAKFSGTYTLTESCSVTGGATYAITVAPKSASADEVTFQGLYAEPQFIANGHVEADGLAFHMESQAVTTLTDRSISAEGTINADGTSITITYDFWETSTNTKLETCTGTMTK